MLLSFLQVGSADHNVYYYDLRNIKAPLHVFHGHKKAVSYVNFLSTIELVSASIDSTLQLWDVKAQTHVSNLLTLDSLFFKLCGKQDFGYLRSV